VFIGFTNRTALQRRCLALAFPSGMNNRWEAGRMAQAAAFGPVSAPWVWTAAEIGARDDWIFPLSAAALDDCDPEVHITVSVYSSEPPMPGPDATLVGADLKIRNDCDASEEGNGRIYLIVTTATDDVTGLLRSPLKAASPA